MKIEFYLHQVWLALICVLMFAGLLLPIGQLSNAEGASAELTNFRLNFIEGDSAGAMWALGVIMIAILAVGVFELLLSGGLLLFDDHAIYCSFISPRASENRSSTIAFAASRCSKGT